MGREVCGTWVESRKYDSSPCPQKRGHRGHCMSEGAWTEVLRRSREQAESGHNRDYRREVWMPRGSARLSWKSMVQRCTQPSMPGYKNYGGRGIKVTDCWLGPEGFRNFLADMGERPDGMTLDRIDVDGNYEPGNCRWADAKTQASNKRRNKGVA
jgi:hypothetical protein